MTEKELAQQILNNVKTGLWQKYRRPVLICLGVLILLLIVYFAWQKHAETEAKLQQATLLSSQQAKDVNVLQNLLNESKQNAQMLADFISRAQSGKVQPVTNFVVAAGSSDQAAQQVATRINQDDPTLPLEALEKTDRTIVTTVPTTEQQKIEIDKQNAQNGTTLNDQYQVQVYKNNNYRNWEWSAGYGQHGGDRYVPVEVQRNFSKDAAVSYEQHVGGHQSGFEVKYTVKIDKLFGLF
ncbi:hypothetical protein Ga0466249_003387 [Sporomusaceae bacterium BoRhaA]|uniref:hypothetical protein n=1 Tax=Pelorhabdus rhamnosifermentans TaxID=2772457 RepID=UPI001C063FBC|nr:hypothetical protein [Pelorhabdus rhamnosifermentans]MBU2702260.1 hypothetical protein [Pelorhabdus rhamnosifermentans]